MGLSPPYYRTGGGGPRCVCGRVRRVRTRSRIARTRLPLPLLHLLQNLLRLVGETQGISMHLLHNESRSGPSLLHLLRHELHGFERIPEPFAHCFTHRHP